MSNKIPKTINTNEVKNPIDMFAYPFVKLVQWGEFNYVYRSLEVFFVVEDGFCFCTPHFKMFDTYEDFYKKIEKLKDGGFKDVEKYEEALLLEIYKLKNYEDFKDSSFYIPRYHPHYIGKYNTQNVNKNIPQYKKYQEAKKLGFKSKGYYENAQRINCEDPELFHEFRNSGFFEQRSRFSQSNYEDFIEARKKGFKTKEHYDGALKLGIKDFKTYEQFLESGCETKEDFEQVLKFQKKLPKLKKQYEHKMNTIEKDAKKALDSGFLSEYVRLKYLLLEKFSELLYMIIYEVPIDENNELYLEDLIEKIENKLNHSIVSKDELHTWRLTRNDIVHEHYKVNDDELQEAKKFFKGVESKFESILMEYN